MRKLKKSAKQRQINRNKKQLKRKAKSLAKAKKKFEPESRRKNHKTYDFKVDGNQRQHGNLCIMDDQDKIIKDIFEDYLKAYSKIDTTCIFSSLLLSPIFQASQYRLEKAIIISLSFCSGDKKPDLDLIKFILEKSSELFGHLEDPSEDVFVSTVWFENEQYKICTGLWEGGIYQTQIFLDLIESAPANEKNNPIKSRVRSILKASDLIISKNGLRTNEIGAEYPIEGINYNEFDDFNEFREGVKLTQFNESEFLPCIDLNNLQHLYLQELGASDLEEKPFFVDGDSCFLILPSSLPSCLRRQIINFVRKYYSTESLDSLFWGHQAKKIYETKLLQEFKNLPIKFDPIKEAEGWVASESLVSSDEGYFFHFIFLGESLNALGKDWFSGFTLADDSLVKHIEKSIFRAKAFAIEKQGGFRGCSIIVPCGYGKGLGIGNNFESDYHWMLAVINSHDIDTLSNDSDCKPHIMWRIIESLQQLRKMGVKLFNLNGFLNLYAYAKDNNYCIVPHEFFQESSRVPSEILLNIPSNSQVELRRQVLKNTEKLLVFHHQLGAIKVMRAFGGDSLFSTDDKYDIYCPENINQNIFQCIYIDDDLKIWIEQEILHDYDFSLQFQFFDAALSWIKKIFTVISHENLIVPDNLQVWHLSFDFPEDPDKIKECPEPDKILSSFSNEFVSPVLYSRFGLEFYYGIRSEDNISEQALILSLVSFICGFNPAAEINKVLQKIIESPAARYIHFFVAKNYREYFIKDKTEPIYIEQTDENNIKLNFGWNCRKRSDGNIIVGKEACKNYLNKMVESTWRIVKSKLEFFNRELLIENLLMNMEYAHFQKQRWERTYKANLAIQKDKENVRAVVNDKIGRINAVSLSTRLIIEMAICESPLDGGRKPGKLDIQELICLASMMHHLGGLSEAINYDAVEPRLNISTFGDILYDHDFEDIIIKSYSSAVNEKLLATVIEDYPNYLLEQQPTGTVDHLFEDKFMSSWIDEFGFSVDDARFFRDELEIYGFGLNKLVYKISHKDLLKLFDEEKQEIIEKIINELVISPRNSWTIIPSPFKPTDWQPWRFRRRYSLIMRPIVRFDDSNFLISPQLVHDGFSYLVRSCHSATIDENHFSSRLMKKWVGDKRNNVGLAFNKEVANRLQALGWKTKTEIKLTEILNKKLPDFGDIDVFAWNEKFNMVAVIECKDLSFAKTQGEIARQLFDFKGQKNEKGKKDRLLKHIDRINVLNDNLIQLSNFTQMNSNMNINGYVVFSNPVPMIFNDKRSYKDQIDFLVFDQLEQLGRK